MLSNYLSDLQHTIQWAQFEDDLDVLRLARERMEKALRFIAGISPEQQQAAYRQVDELLPMEWPLWMEACRYQDSLHKNTGMFH